MRCAQETFLDLMLPVVSATIKHFELQQEQTSGLHPRVRKALRRRERLKARPRVEDESDAVFKVRDPHALVCKDTAACGTAGCSSLKQQFD